MAKNIFTRIGVVIKNITSFLLTGDRNRERVIRELNNGFYESFRQSECDYLCIVDTAVGDRKFKHELSNTVLISGLRITIVNNKNLAKSEIIEYSKCITESKPFVRQLMAMGYDTLIIKPKNNIDGLGINFLQIGFNKFADLKNFQLKN